MYKKLIHLVSCVTVLALAGSASADLVGHWKLDETGGTAAVDSSGNGNAGAIQGNPVWVAGSIGGAMECDGDDWIDCGDILPLTQGLTIMAWVNPTNFSGDHGFASRDAAYAIKSSSDHLRFTTPGLVDYDGNATILENGAWQHVAATFVPNTTNGLIFYLNGVESERLTTTALNAGSGPFRIANNQWSQFLVGAIDEVRVYDNILTPEEILDAMVGAGPELAVEPSPESEAVDVPRETVLSWTPGEFAATHDVYLGTSLDDVNDASRANAMGVLVSQGQVQAAYDTGRLEFGQTYYWRVDEVNAAPDNTIFKGEVWSFTVEPFAYPVANITATSNGLSDDGVGPENTINGSGLNADDKHATDSDTMWLARQADTDPLWIQYEFDGVYKLHEMLVWNYNVQFELLLGFGIQNVTVEYSEDGATWMSLGDVDLVQATAREDYVYNTVVDLGGVAAQYVKLMINGGFGAMGQYGLSEVRFLYIPAQAREPEPADGETSVAIDTLLRWRAGREAVAHEVYLGTEPNALALVDTVDASSYTPDALDLAMTYYWQINEVNEAEAISSWAGGLWSFSTQEYIVVDDFESYTNEEGNRIYETWIDGWVNDTGSTVGYLEEPFAETTIVHSGSQAMPLFYDNAGVAAAEAEFTLAQNWTANGIKSLTLYFYGDPGNTGQLYVKINGSRVDYDGAAGDLADPQWQPWNIDLSGVGGNLSNVTELILGIEGAGASGVLYVDDIRLYPETPQFVVPVQPDEANLVAHYAFEGDLTDSVGGHNGTAKGDAQVVSDPDRGQVLSLDGGGDAVDVAYSAELNPEAFTVSLWANPDPAGLNYRSPLTSRDDGPQRGYILYLEPGNTWQFWTGTGTGWDNAAGPSAVLGEWTHVAATFENDTKQLYVNGRQVAESTAPLSLNQQRPLRIGAGATEGDGNYYFQGLIDEVLLYNRALSAAEVAGLAGRTEPLHQAF